MFFWEYLNNPGIVCLTTKGNSAYNCCLQRYLKSKSSFCGFPQVAQEWQCYYFTNIYSTTRKRKSWFGRFPKWSAFLFPLQIHQKQSASRAIVKNQQKCWNGITGRGNLIQELKAPELKISSSQSFYHLYHAPQKCIWKTSKERVDAKWLSAEIAGWFVGVVIGIYATSQGELGWHAWNICNEMLLSAKYWNKYFQLIVLLDLHRWVCEYILISVVKQ